MACTAISSADRLDVTAYVTESSEVTQWLAPSFLILTAQV